MRHDPDFLADLSLGAESTVSDATIAALDRADAVPGFGVDAAATLAWAVDAAAARPASSSLAAEWELLAAVSARDVGAARILEPHLDALGILREAREAHPAREARDTGLSVDPEASWGVFAAEAAGVRLRAERGADGWRLHGTKPWCSLAAHLSHALVTAWVDDERRQLFAVELRSSAVSARPGPWHARGLAQIVSAPVDFDGAPADPVGEAGWYLRRPGFARGGAGVAACWWGGAIPLRDALRAAVQRDGSDQLARVHLGRVDTALWTARSVLRDAAEVFERGSATASSLLATRVRSVVFEAVELALREAERALGPLPLVADEAHARRVADLQLYLGQHPADRALARIGGDIADGSGSW